MKARYYVVTLDGCVEPSLHGPFASDAERLAKARALYGSDEYSQDYDAIFALDVSADGSASVAPFAGIELDRTDAIVLCGCSSVTGACAEHKAQNAAGSSVAEAVSEADEVSSARRKPLWSTGL